MGTKRLRKLGWDYSSTATYFITVSTYQSKPYFGKIVDHRVVLSEQGQIAKERWERTPHLAPNVSLGEYAIMPNHMHMLVNFKRTGKIEELNASHFGPQTKNISSLIRGFKASVKSETKRRGLGFKWHPRFHERVVFDEEAIQNIERYIRNNPENYGKKGGEENSSPP